MIELMTVPAKLLADVVSGGAYVSGALVKDAATHQILAHLQPTSLLSHAISMGASGPFGALGAVGDVVQGAQLLQIKQMLETLQTVASIGAAAAVLNLGVSVGGFAMVLSALKKVDSKLDAIQSAVHNLHRKADTGFFADIITVLRRAEGGFLLAQADRHHRWLATEDRIDTLIEHSVQRLAMIGVTLERTPGPDVTTNRSAWLQLAAPEPLHLLSGLFNLVGARTEVLLCLQRPAEAAQLSRRSAAWLATLPTDAKALAIARVAGRALSSQQLGQVVLQARALTTWVTASGGVASERANLFQSLHDQGVDTPAYVQQVRDHPEKVLLVLPHRSGPYTSADA